MIEEITLDDAQSRMTLLRVPNRPGIAADLFEGVAKQGIFVDMIVQSYASEEVADISFTVPREQFSKSLEVTRRICESFGAQGVEFQEEIAKLTVSGIGLRSHTGVAIGMFEALARERINIEMINTSEIRVNVVVKGNDGQRGLECLRKQFENAVD